MRKKDLENKMLNNSLSDWKDAFTELAEENKELKSKLDKTPLKMETQFIDNCTEAFRKLQMSALTLAKELNIKELKSKIKELEESLKASQEENRKLAIQNAYNKIESISNTYFKKDNELRKKKSLMMYRLN